MAKEYKMSAITERKEELLDSMIEKLESMVEICKEIKDGRPETAACRSHNIDQRYFRNLLFSQSLIKKSPYPECDDTWKKEILEWTERHPDMEITQEMIDNGDIPYLSIKEEWDNLQGGERLFCEVFGVDNYLMIPDCDLDDEFIKAISHLTDIEQEILTKYYFEGYTLKQIADEHNRSLERIRQRRNRAVRKLRGPSISVQFKFGSEFAATLSKLKKDINQLAKRKAENEIKAEIDSVADNLKKAAEKDREVLTNIDGIKIEDIGLSTRTYNCMRRAGFTNLCDLIGANYYDLLKIRNMGEKSLDELELVCGQYGIYFSKNKEEAIIPEDSNRKYSKKLLDLAKQQNDLSYNNIEDLSNVSRSTPISRLPLLPRETRAKLILAGFKILDDFDWESLYDIARIRDMTNEEVDKISNLVANYNIHMAQSAPKNRFGDYVKVKED